jgi:hypothetical protein
MNCDCTHPVASQIMPLKNGDWFLTCRDCGEQTVNLKDAQEKHGPNFWLVLVDFGFARARFSAESVHEFFGLSVTSRVQEIAHGALGELGRHAER